MSSPFAFAGILVLLCTLSVSNHVLVRFARRLTDQRAEAGLPWIPRPPFGLPLIQGLLQRLASRRQSKKLSKAIRNASGCLMGFFFDVLRRTEFEIAVFPNWNELPFAFGKWTTLFLILGTTFVLSDDLILGQFGIGLNGFSPDFCTTNVFHDKLSMFQDDLKRQTNLPIALRQYEYASGLRDALVADAALYGEEGFQCPDLDKIPGNKPDWNDQMAVSRGTFFPNYCEEAMEASIRSAQEQTCHEKKCACVKKRLGFLGTVECCWCGKVCVDVPFACPAHTADQESELTNYRVAQYERAEAQREAFLNATLPPINEDIMPTRTQKTAQKIFKQVDIAGTLYAIYAGIALFFPAPLAVYRVPTDATIRQVFFGAKRSTFILFVLSVWWGVEYTVQLLRSPDLNLYVLGSILRDPCMMDGNFILARQQAVSDVCEQLVPIEPRLHSSVLTINNVLDEANFFVKSCDCAFPNQNLAVFTSRDRGEIDNVTELGFGRVFDGFCDDGECPVSVLAPEEDFHFAGNTSFCSDLGFATQLLATPSAADAKWWEIWLSTGLLAQIVIKFAAINFLVALYRWADPLSSCGGSCLVSPHFLSRKTKQKKALVLGQNRSNGHRLKSTMIEQKNPKESNRATQTVRDAHLKDLRMENERNLRLISLKWSVFWGAISLSCIANLIAAFWMEVRGYDLATSKSEVVGTSSVFAAVMVIPLTCLARQQIQKHLEVTSLEADTYNSDSDLENDSPTTPLNLTQNPPSSSKESGLVTR